MMPMDHTSPLYCITCQSLMGKQYLSCIESHCYGTRFHPWFSARPYEAIPLSLDQAEFLQKHFENDIELVRFQIEPVPWESHKEDQ